MACAATTTCAVTVDDVAERPVNCVLDLPRKDIDRARSWTFSYLDYERSDMLLLDELGLCFDHLL